MQSESDAELLRDYAANQSEAAFREIVRRYADFVYSAALRQVGNAEQARDVAQIVFTDLARKAGSLRKGTVLIGWLCNGARLAALESLRKDQRRLQRERLAMDLHDPSPQTPDDWSAVRQVLDEGIARLSTEDRDALLLRYFKNASLAAIGATLGVSEDAAQKRVSRALGRLRDFLTERGINTPAAALSAALIANGVQAAPVGFAASLASGALTNAVGGSSTASFLKLFTASNMKTAILSVALAAGVAGLTVKQVKLQHQLSEALALTQQRQDELDSLRVSNAQAGIQADELERLRNEAKDVLRLRAEVTQLRQSLAERTLLLKNERRTMETNSPTSAVPPPQMHIRARFVMMPTGGYGTEVLATGILTEPQFKQTLKLLETTPGADIIGDSQVVTLSGRQAQLQTESADSNNPTIVFDVLPVCVSNSARIDLTFSLFLGNPPPIQRLHVSSGSLMLPSVTRGAPMQALEMTNTLTLWDGQTVVWSKKLADREIFPTKDTQGTGVSGPRNLVVFVTPTLIDPAGNRIFSDQSASQVSNSAGAASISAFPGMPPNPPQ